MARPLRIEFPGAVYHVTGRGNERRAIFREDEDRRAFLDILADVRLRYNWLCHAYCLMENHYHVVIETPEGNLSIGMRQLNGIYTQRFNKRHGRVGHLLQGRFKAILIQKDSYLLEVCRYVVLNPVRAGIVQRPEEWIWSSYGATAGFIKVPPYLVTEWVLSQFGSERETAEAHYRGFVGNGIGGESIWKGARAQSVLGEEGFVKSLKEHVKGRQGIPEIVKSQRFLSRPALEEVLGSEVLRNRRARDEAMRKAVYDHGYTQKEVADHLGLHFTSVSRILRTKGKMLKK